MKKKILSILLVLSMLLGISAVIPATVFAAETITIANESDWLALCGTEVSGNVTVTAKALDFEGETVTPIKFSNGTFDGNGVVITGVDMEANCDAALFCSVSGATIKNIVIDDSSFSVVLDDEGKNGNWVAALACCGNNSTIENIYVKEDVSIYTEAGYAGGILGGITGSNNTVTIRSCIYEGTMTAASTANKGGCGGIVGNSNSGSNKKHNVTIEYCLVTGRVPNNVDKSSGFVGTIENGTSKPVATLTSCIYAGGEEDEYFYNRPFGHASVFEVTDCYTTHTAANGVYNNVKWTASGSGVQLVDRSDLEGADAIDVTGFKKMADGIMIPTGIANYLYPVADGEITFKNWDGTVLQTGVCEGGIMPEYKGATPTKPDSKFYTYEFDGWTPSVDIVNGAAVYTATFTESLKIGAPIYVGGKYVINAVSQWFYLMNNVDEFDGETIELGADLDFEGADDIIKPVSGFAGTLDGKGYTIKNVTMSRSAGDIALFDTLGDNSTVKNLVIKSSTFEIKGKNNWLGTIACCTNGKNVTISNIYVDKDVKVISNTTHDNSIAGGILGGVYGSGSVVTISDCVFAGSVTGKGAYVAGIVSNAEAENTTTVINCINTGTVIAKGNYVAGIAVGGDLTIENCVNVGNVIGKNYYGDIYGGNPAGEITIINCYSAGKFEGHNTANSGTVTIDGGESYLGSYNFIGLGAKVPATFTKRSGDIAVPSGCTVFPASTILCELSLINGASVRFSEPTGLRFMATLGGAYLNTFGANATFGIIIAPTDYIESDFETLINEGTAGVDYLVVPATKIMYGGADAGYYVFSGVLTNVRPENYDREFSAIAYIEVDGEYYFSAYDAEYNSRSIAEVANAAYEDTNYEETAEYCYEISENAGVYSPYSATNREKLLAFYSVEDAVDINFLSYNIRNVEDTSGWLDRPTYEYDNRNIYLRDYLLNYNADVIGLQEASWLRATLGTLNWFDTLGDENTITGLTAAGYTCVKGEDIYGGGNSDKKMYNPIYFKSDVFECVANGTKWLTSTPDVASTIAGAETYKALNYAVLRHIETGEEFVFVNVHLIVRRTNYVHDGEGNDTEFYVQQLETIYLRAILQDLQDEYDLPMFICGDFNNSYSSINDWFKNSVVGENEWEISDGTPEETIKLSIARDQAVSKAPKCYSCTTDDFTQINPTAIEEGWGAIDLWWTSNFDGIVHTYQIIDNKTTTSTGEKYPSDHLPARLVVTLYVENN